MDLAMLKKMAKVDGNFDDDVILFLQEVAEEIIDATLENPEAAKETKRYQQAVALLVRHYYDNHEIVMAGGMVETPYGVLTLIQQLRGV